MSSNEGGLDLRNGDSQPAQVEAHPMDSFLESGMGPTQPAPGEVRDGIIARITPTEVLVDIGAKSEGVIDARELERMPPEARQSLAVGESVLVYVVQPEDANGNIVLSFSRAQEEKDWREAEALLASQQAYEGQVAGFNKGGLIVRVGNVRGFVPASQFSPSRRRLSGEGATPEQKWGRMVGETMHVKVIEIDRERNRLILSERAAAKENRAAQRERLLSGIKEGEVLTGRVISLADFGVFVDLGGADGLVHLSELSWKRVAHPKELLRVGQEVQVQVLSVDRDRKRIALSMKRLESDPWDTMASRIRVGQLVRGTITKLTKFGAFARVQGAEDTEGLIHISELSDERVENPRSVVQEGQEVTLRVVKIDPEKRRLGLSLKRVSNSEYLDSDWSAFESEDLEAS
jgi:small subunit ribosomal protein S1